MPSRVTKKAQTRIALPDDDDAFIRKPTVLAVYPVGETTWDRGVAAGRFPRPVRLSPRIVAWRVGEIRELLASVDKPL